MRHYSQDNVKKYKFWTVRVHPNQEYLGRCVIWCDRKDACDLVDATQEELLEFSEIIREFKPAIEKSFSPDWMSYSFLGFDDKHLHCHMVPRYKNDREFNGTIFQDKRRWKNRLLDESLVTSDEMIDAIKKKIQENL